jgi:thiamine biosynthesis protein ThiI
MNTVEFKGPGVVLRPGELFLKGKNRYVFEQTLERNVRRVIRDQPELKVVRKHGRLFVVGACEADLIARLGRVFGISSLSPVVFSEKRIDAICAHARALAERFPPDARTFRITPRRSDKGFPHTSADIGRIVGAEVAEATGLGVDLTEYNVSIGVEVGPEWTFLYSEQQKGAGGLPVGTSGNALLLLSGGIDSPVAGHLMQKRGLDLEAVYYHAFPYTGDGAKEKVVRLAGLLAERQHRLTLHVVPFTKVQERFRDTAEAKLLVILYRRAIVRIAGMIASARHLRALVTGESLGQVASQTLHNLTAIEDAAPLPVLRPLIGSDKSEIIEISKQIGAFDISILPHEDCCSLFVPRHPETHASLKRVWKTESKIDWRSVVEEAFGHTETVSL